MQLQESGQMYLETIFILEKEKRGVRSVDVAEYMHFSKPSVSRAIGLLKDGDYVIVDEDGFLELTKEGREVASKTYERHTTLTKLFEKLGVNPDTAAKDACKIEHDISDETFLAIKEHIKKL